MADEVRYPSRAECAAVVDIVWGKVGDTKFEGVDDGRLVALQPTWGIGVQAIRQARAYFALTAGGDFEREGWVNVRVALEHALSAQWVLHRRGALSVLQRHIHHNLKAETERLADWIGDQSLKEKAALIDVPDGDPFPGFTRMAEQLVNTETLTVPYARLSLATHVRADTSLVYQRTGEDGHLQFFLDPQGVSPLPGPFTAAMAATLAGYVIFELCGDEDALRALAEITEALQLPFDIRDEFPAAIRRDEAFSAADND
ncbi:MULTISPECIES: hypothetical protein [unclassified Cryobacterium]|uniref:hypothetical protein n=1 Tax=unclassified Cryobacterium TaxID=2649013 RepID=UPI002AB41283|nr:MULTISPECIES: hypothetical protein [unclassified Cryobacterium]MDY7543362.1 hypothetical protein [Cryobacterium sp. 5B3]MEB0000411.1 hypothetical protein [Cryobacterium sp. RTS3]MEB0267984.1 hypothetical protein [Cryobacterium sp. 10I5]MEB0276113.1 hypothetical protein [Cryobacterium sp. 5B3]